ncbi:hypothetical protein HanRHA438_Chr01g0014741 [Helianthus annuus]|nr:hypothetical protein HanRHA438_Chr01g0014741 [Helianthus annuus]
MVVGKNWLIDPQKITDHSFFNSPPSFYNQPPLPQLQATLSDQTVMGSCDGRQT